MNQVLILGGYGNFGARIAASLVKDKIPIIIAGRDLQKAQALGSRLRQQASSDLISYAIFDAAKELDKQLETLKPKVVINTIGPLQTADYSIPKTCILHGAHYLDLADARGFVTGITQLDALAKQHQVLVVSGASTVPGLSSAVLDYYCQDFLKIKSLIYGISPGQKAPRGLATTESILTYLGKPLRPWKGSDRTHFGWQDIYLQDYPELGKRWMANCDIPDLDIFPEKYAIETMHFSAGMESSLLHLGMWLTSWLVRMGLPLDLSKHAKKLLALSHLFDFLGTEDGGMHMLINGTDKNNNPVQIEWFLIAKKGEGPQIPCVPAIILAKKLMQDSLAARGALPCVSMISLDEYLQELEGFAVEMKVRKSSLS